MAQTYDEWGEPIPPSPCRVEVTVCTDNKGAQVYGSNAPPDPLQKNHPLYEFVVDTLHRIVYCGDITGWAEGP